MGPGERAGGGADHRWVVDGIEEGVARVEEDGERLLHVPLWLLPQDVEEGSVLRVGVEGGAVRTVKVELDREATEAALRRSREQAAKRPTGNDPGGPIRL